MMTELQKEMIYRDHHGKVYGYMLSRLSDPQDAEDLTGTVFVKVFEKLDSFDESRASLSTWIYTIARNTLTDFFRTRREFTEIPESLDDGSDIENEVCNAEALRALAAALEALPQKEREIIVLHYYSGKTLKEIASRLGFSYSYVRVLQSRALEKLKDFLQ